MDDAEHVHADFPLVCRYNYSRDLGKEPLSDEGVDCNLPATHIAVEHVWRPEMRLLCADHARLAVAWKWVARVPTLEEYAREVDLELPENWRDL